VLTREPADAELLAADYFIVKTRNMFLYTWQAGIYYTITPEHELRLTYARKNHFPTMSQRYSTRFGTTLPNPRLGR
jgi:iron complex outermembrane receptor protein